MLRRHRPFKFCCVIAILPLTMAIIGCLPAVGTLSNVGGPAGFDAAAPGGGGFANAGPTGAFDGEFGATQGGVQDMGLARELVDNARVPPAEAFVVEGMFSEHDLGLTGDACERELCVRGALGIVPDAAGDPSGWFQLGLSSTIDPETFVRPSLTLIACVDVSGSMGWPYGSEDSEYPTPGTVARALLRAIAGELGPDDRIAIVTFGSEVATALELTPGDSDALITSAIDGLGEGGSTYLEAGVQRAYELANAAPGDTTETRVMLFTDVQPNVGSTAPSEFEQMVAAGADENIGMTIMAFGVGLGQELLNAMAHLRGGNAFSLFDYEDVTTLMEDNWPWLVSPIAHDLNVRLTTSAGFEVGEAYGFPAAESGEAPGLDVATVFLSKNKGALLMQLVPSAGAGFDGMAVTAELSYETPAGDPIAETIDVAYAGEELDANGEWYQQASVRKTIALALLTTAMADAADQYGTDAEAAIATLEDAIARFDNTAEALADEALNAELDFANELLQLMQAGAEQGDLYGQTW